MPCNSDHLEPTRREVYNRDTAFLYAHALESLNQKIPDTVYQAMADTYCPVDFTSELCSLIRAMDWSERDRIVFNAYDRTARRLADWWEEHDKADELRRQDRYEEIIRNLSDEDIDILKERLGR